MHVYAKTILADAPINLTSNVGRSCQTLIKTCLNCYSAKGHSGSVYDARVRVEDYAQSIIGRLSSFTQKIAGNPFRNRNIVVQF